MPSSRLTADLAVRAYVDALEAVASGDLLDLGCGHVPLYGAYEPLVSSVTCVDWQNTAHPSPHLDLVADLNEPIALPSASFDTVLLTDVLEHLPRPDDLFREVHRLLRPGGVLIVGVPFLYWIHEAPHDHHRYTEFRLRRFCDDHGFTVGELSAYGDELHVAADLFTKIAARRQWLARLAAAAVGPLAVRHAPKPRTVMPLGYVLVAERPGAVAVERP